MDKTQAICHSNFYNDGVTTTINLTVPVCENRNRLSLPCCEATDGKAADFPSLKAIR